MSEQQKRYPFKFLNSYTQADTDIFFGRDEEIELLYEMIFQADILTIYGASGTGKTSLIQCGLAKKFQSHDWFALYIRRGANLNTSLANAIQAQIGENADTETQELDWLDDFMEEEEGGSQVNTISKLGKQLKKVYMKHFRPIYLVFDQFEEMYILGTTKEEQQQFIETVKEILGMEQPIKLLFSIREEYLGYLYEFEKQIPQLLRKKLRVEPMNLEKVTTVIHGATNLTKFQNSLVSLAANEKDLIPQKVFDLLRDRKENRRTIPLTYLQVLLDKLYINITRDETRKQEAVFTLKDLEKLGEIGDVLRDFLEEQVNRISQNTKNIHPKITITQTWQFLSPFVTLEGTKAPLSKHKLVERLQTYSFTEKLVDILLKEFEKSRILRYVEEDGVFEIAHDSLAQRVAEKRTNEEIALLKVKNIINSQLTLNKGMQELFSEKKLIFIEPYLNKLNLGTEEIKLISDSRRSVDQASKENQIRRVILIGALSLATLVSIGIAVFVWFNMEKVRKEQARTKELTIEVNLQEAKALMEQEDYKGAIQKYYFLQDVILSENDTIKIEEFLASCKNSDSLKALFYQYLKLADSLLALKNIKDSQLLDCSYLLKSADSLNYMVGVSKLEHSFNTYKKKLAEREDFYVKLIEQAENSSSALHGEAPKFREKLRVLNPDHPKLRIFTGIN